MTHHSLFKEAAQRIVQRAQSSQNDADTLPAARLGQAPGTQAGQSGQMMGSTFAARASLTSPTDTSPAPRR